MKINKTKTEKLSVKSLQPNEIFLCHFANIQKQIMTVVNFMLVKSKGKQFKSVFFLTVLFLASCQTTSEQEELSQTDQNTPGQYEAQIESFLTQNQEQRNQHALDAGNKLKSTDTGNVQADYSQSRAPMSAGTKKRLKAHAQELNNRGSIPEINYQAPDAPALKIISDPQQDSDAPVAIKLDYEQVEIRQILEEFADSLDMSIIIDPSISGSVTMRTAPNASLSKEDLWPLLQMILSEAGVVLERRGEIFHAKRSPQLLPSTIGRASILDTTDASRVMQITPLKHISIEAAMTVLKPIAGPKGGLVPVPSLNTLLIVDRPELIKRFNGLLSIIDSDPFKNRGIQLYKIRQAEAKDVAKELEDILKLIEGNKPAYQVMGLERINALLVVAPPGRGFKDVSRWVDILDAGADEALVEQIFIYKCKSLKATALAGTLNAIFQQEDPTIEKPKEEANDNPFEFKTVTKESLSTGAAAKRAIDKEKGVTAPVKNNRKSSGEAGSADIRVTIVADEDSNTLLIRTTAKDYKQLLATIRVLDIIPLQVLINVVIAQVTLTDAQQFGIDWAYLGSGRSTYQTNFGQAQAVGDSGDPLGLILNRITSNWRITLNALAKESDVNILSRPSLLITNNQEGVINVGKEVPVETSNTTNTNSTDIIGGTNITQQIAYRKTGIELTVTPQINEDGMVTMVIKQGLSAIEGQTSGGDTGLNPTFTNQEINTTVIVRDKETIILGGLIESIEVDGESGVPILKDVPLMGYLFKNQGSQVERRELILIISTNILNANDNYDDFNNAFKGRYYAAASFLDEQLEDDNRKRLLNKHDYIKELDKEY